MDNYYKTAYRPVSNECSSCNKWISETGREIGRIGSRPTQPIKVPIIIPCTSLVCIEAINQKNEMANNHL